MTDGLPGLRGRRAVVTGGSRGIGRATAVGLAAAGASVGIAYRRDEEAARSALEAMREAGVYPEARFWSYAGDLSRADAAAGLFDSVDREFGGLDVFVGNAGVWNEGSTPIDALEEDAWRAMLDANLTSAYRTTRAAVARMGEGGCIVLLSSTAGQRGEAGHSAYAASKGAIISFVKSLAVELGPRGIRVNAVAPGWVDTDMSASVLRRGSLEAVLREIPLGRVATAEDVAGPILFLASDLASQITGEILNVNGGSVRCG
ncbi:MAG: SDR family NAD(P)-dependent oxidoreductase [Gemmatimonadota bacterium]